MLRSKQSQGDTPGASLTPDLGPPITPRSSGDVIRPASATVHETSWLAPDVEGQSQISGNENLRIDGTVEAPISLKCSRLTVGRRGKVVAEVVAREVVVYGKVYGKLRARDRIEIKKDGSVVGDLTTARILIEDGAHFKGNMEIERRKTPRDLSHEGRGSLRAEQQRSRIEDHVR